MFGFRSIQQLMGYQRNQKLVFSTETFVLLIYGGNPFTTCGEKMAHV